MISMAKEGGGTGARTRAAFVGFLEWWKEELSAMLPAALKRLLARRKSALLVEFEEGVAHLWLEGREGRRAVGTVPAGRRPRLAGVDRVELRLKGRSVLVAELRLPLAAEENLREVLGFEMDRHTPFTAEQVYFDYRLLDRDPEGGGLDIVLYLIPRPELERPLATLAAWGTPATHLTLLDEHGELLDLSGLLPAEGRRRGGGARAMKLLLGTAGLLTVAALLLPLYAKSVVNERYQNRLDQVRKDAAETQRLRSRWEAVVERGGFLDRKRAERPLVVVLLDEMTRVIPDDTWLDRLQLDGGEIKLQGESESASRLLGLIEASPRFREAHFASPVTRNPRTERERFVIQLRVAQEEKK